MELMKGSLNTFLNAFTYPDRTCYPVASTNKQVGPGFRASAALGTGPGMCAYAVLGVGPGTCACCAGLGAGRARACAALGAGPGMCACAVLDVEPGMWNHCSVRCSEYGTSSM